LKTRSIGRGDYVLHQTVKISRCGTITVEPEARKGPSGEQPMRREEPSDKKFGFVRPKNLDYQ